MTSGRLPSRTLNALLSRLAPRPMARLSPPRPLHHRFLDPPPTSPDFSTWGMPVADFQNGAHATSRYSGGRFACSGQPRWLRMAHACFESTSARDEAQNLQKNASSSARGARTFTVRWFETAESVSDRLIRHMRSSMDPFNVE
jgi:hypothetical protein